MVALVNYLSQILIAVVALANLVVVLSKAITSSSRIEAVFAIPSGDAGGKEEPETLAEDILRAEDLSYRYSEKSGNALEKISFSLGKGQNLGIVGGTGAGTSTLLSLLAGTDDPTSGRILYRGKDIRTLPVKRVREEIVRVLQRSVLFSGSVRENLTLGRNDSDDAFLLDCCQKAGALDFVSQIGLDGLLTEGGSNLSGGQKQRLCIARALAARPKVLLLDDSFSALDFATEASVRSSLVNRGQTTLVVVSQRLSSVAFCDKILFLENGKQIAFGSHTELLASCPAYAALWKIQTEKEGA